MRSLEDLDLLPEPDDHRILTVIDQSAPGYPGADYGLTDQEARELRWPIGPMKKILWPNGAIIFSVSTVILIATWPWISALLIPILPDSEWAYEDTGIRQLQNEGYLGQGVHVCIIDTGIDMEHPDFSHQELIGFRDFVEEKHDKVRDVGEDSHGTLMSGLLISNGTFLGAAPEVDLSVALALDDEGSSGSGERVAQAIRWCRITQRVDIISLSLGGQPSNFSSNSQTNIAVQEALDSGIFVVAAAGNTGLDLNINDVSQPSSLPGVISVGAISKSGYVWGSSAFGSSIDPYSDTIREYPNQKPEVIAPGVNIFSTASSSLSSPYAYSSGTSDSTVFVTGALALIIQQFGDEIAGADDIIDEDEMMKVKQSLATSSDRGNFENNVHDSHSGYGSLNAVKWSQEVAFSFNIA
ncbi:MAG: S8 family serine peptidase [Candidatus Thalassarchaeum sp.]|nr:S8 family serine peptidase [Candidatus Thalassarchaeum sp.]